MNELTEILKPTWGAEKWILEGWKHITPDERQMILERMSCLFEQGLPFKMHHDKLFYIYTFAFLAQLEVLAIQVPLKFQHCISEESLQARLRQQLLDEIFHGLVFCKIVYLLSAPLAYPPEYNENLEALCNFIREEECPKIAIILLNLVAEGWIEEVFCHLRQQNIAPQVFDLIIEDEHRHVSEAELYQAIGLPEHDLMSTKLHQLEELLLKNIFMQAKYMISVSSLLGVQASMAFLTRLHEKHSHQLEKVQLKPSENWCLFIEFSQSLFPQVQKYSHLNDEIPMTPFRQLLMTQWDNPKDPTMCGEFDIDVTELGFFEKKYPPETITVLTLQALSRLISQSQEFRQFLSHHKLYRSEHAYVGLVVKLPGCQDHLGTIVFENCHYHDFTELSAKIPQILQTMVYCYQERQTLEQKFPYLTELAAQSLADYLNDFYTHPLRGNAVTSLSNIGFCGYQRGQSPLRKNEAVKFTLFEIQRKPSWNHETQQFEPRDFLPVSCSADHRVFDGNIPIPKMLKKSFIEMCTLMKSNTPSKSSPNHTVNMPFPKLEEVFMRLEKQHELIAYRILSALQTYWLDFIDLDTLLSYEAKIILRG